MRRALWTALLIGLPLAALTGCDDREIRATVDHGPVELDHPTAWFDLTDGARVGHNRAGPDALANNVRVTPDPVLGLVGVFEAGSLSFLPPVHRDFTVVFWLKTTQQGPKQMGWVTGPRLVDADWPGQALDFGVSLSLDKLAFGIGDPNDLTRDQTSMQSVHAVVDGHWHHIAVTRDGTTGVRQIFIDGVLDIQNTALPGELKLPPTILVGQRIATAPPSPVLNAQLADLRFYDRVVSASAIAFLATP